MGMFEKRAKSSPGRSNLVRPDLGNQRNQGGRAGQIQPSIFYILEIFGRIQPNSTSLRTTLILLYALLPFLDHVWEMRDSFLFNSSVMYYFNRGGLQVEHYPCMHIPLSAINMLYFIRSNPCTLLMQVQVLVLL
jgi:hypothetical protein